LDGRSGSTRIDFWKGFEQHKVIFESIRLGQPELVERTLLDHLQTVALGLILETTNAGHLALQLYLRRVYRGSSARRANS